MDFTEILHLMRERRAEPVETLGRPLVLPLMRERRGGELMELRLGGGAGRNAGFSGGTGTGKTQLLRRLLLTAATRYPPNEVRIWCAGYTVEEFMDLAVPGIRFFDLDQGIASFIQALRGEIEEREAAIAAMNRASYEEYCAMEVTGVAAFQRIPRLLVLIDDLHRAARYWESRPGLFSSLGWCFCHGPDCGVHCVVTGRQIPWQGLFAQEENQQGVDTHFDVQGHIFCSHGTQRNHGLRLKVGRPFPQGWIELPEPEEQKRALNWIRGHNRLPKAAGSENR